jgi:hypothetical protein
MSWLNCFTKSVFLVETGLQTLALVLVSSIPNRYGEVVTNLLTGRFSKVLITFGTSTSETVQKAKWDVHIHLQPKNSEEGSI